MDEPYGTPGAERQDTVERDYNPFDPFVSFLAAVVLLVMWALADLIWYRPPPNSVW